jgi:hypothetical protein
MSFFARRRFFEVCATTLLANRAGICPHARACRGVSGPPLAPPTRPGRPQGGRRGCRGGGKSRTLTLTPRPNTVLQTAQAPPAAAPTRAPVRGRLWSEGCSLQSDGRTIRLCSLWPSDDLPTPLQPPVDTVLWSHVTYGKVSESLPFVPLIFSLLSPSCTSQEGGSGGGEGGEGGKAHGSCCVPFNGRVALSVA